MMHNTKRITPIFLIWILLIALIVPANVVLAGGSLLIIASAGPGGMIAPSGRISVSSGASQAFRIEANSGYHIADILVDGVSVGGWNHWTSEEYTFSAVQTDHTITASFASGPCVFFYTKYALPGAQFGVNLNYFNSLISHLKNYKQSQLIPHR